MSELRPEDRKWIETVERELRPEPLDARRALAFRRELEGRLARRDARRRFAVPVLVNAALAAAAAAWFLRADAPTPIGVTDERPAQVAAVDAFVDPDADAGGLADAEWLPGDYQVLAALLEDEP